MTLLFADTFYFIALLNPDDEAHDAAEQFSTAPDVRLVTTVWVLTELADGLATHDSRRLFADFLETLETDPRAEVLPPGEDLWRRGIDLYARRPDKQWSLTDCISFTAMSNRGITDALTGDHHFVQAGFRTLLN
jgi:uncharacterized protein